MTRILVAAMSYDAEHGGGSIRLTYDLATGLARRGYQITVVCEDLFGRGLEREVADGVTILRYRLPRSYELNIGRHEEHIRAVKCLVSKYLIDPPEVVHGHNPFQYAAVLDIFQKQSQCCYTIHSPAVDELRITWGARGAKGKLKSLLGLPIIRRLEFNILRKSVKLAAESHYTVGLIAQNYGDTVAQKIQVIPGWVDLEKFHPLPEDQIEIVRRHLGWPVNVPVFFVLRRLEPRMGLDNLLQALALVKKRGFRPYTVIGGSGSLRPSLEKMCDELGLRNDVYFMGFVSANDVPLAYGACDASLIPTAQLECFGIIALEVLACGKPALVTPVGALPEVMRNFQAEWIAHDATANGIADLLTVFLGKRLPPSSFRDIRTVIEREYSYESALSAYERFLTE